MSPSNRLSDDQLNRLAAVIEKRPEVASYIGHSVVAAAFLDLRDARRAALASPTPSLGSPSGVVEALRMLDEMGRRLLKVVESLQDQSMEIDAGYCLNRIDDLIKFIRSLPQAPAAPAAAPVEDDVLFREAKELALLVEHDASDGWDLRQATLDQAQRVKSALLGELARQALAPAQGVEGSYQRQKGAGNADA